MTMFSVKVTSEHEGCKRVCKLDVIAKDWLSAGRRALLIVRPSGAHRVTVKKARGEA